MKNILITIRIIVIACLGGWVLVLFNLNNIRCKLPISLVDYISRASIWMVCGVQAIVSVSWYIYLYKSEQLSVLGFLIIAFVFVVSMFLYAATFFSRYNFLMFLPVLAWLICRLIKKDNIGCGNGGNGVKF